MGLNRIRDVLTKTRLSKSTFYLLRAKAPDSPDWFPDPDGYLNDGATPVWTDQTVEAWIVATLERSRAARRKRPTQRRLAAATLTSAQ